MIKIGAFEIVEYEEKYKNYLKKLSYEWLEKYGLMEAEDERILNNPQQVILDGGGHIFFAKYKGNIVGTVSLIKVDKDTYELAKLAVTEACQGKKIGSRLIQHCVKIAKEEHKKKLVLYTNHVLTTAVHLYHHFNFKELCQGSQKYLETDMKMELNLE